jgi:ubiquinone/menaquinone biosynthesis C-methylase UbiE
VAQLILNLGGEGEIPDVINQQGPWVLTSPSWFASRTAETFQQLVAKGDAYLICSNLALPFPDNSVDLVYTNGVPIGINSTLGPGVQSSEIKRILKPGGQWIKDGIVEWTKP